MARHTMNSYKAINIIFDGPPGPESGKFVEVETDSGESIGIGKWIERDDGFWALRIQGRFIPEYSPEYVDEILLEAGHNPETVANDTVNLVDGIIKRRVGSDVH